MERKYTPQGWSWKVRNERTESVTYVVGGKMHEVFIATVMEDVSNIIICDVRRNIQFKDKVLSDAALIAATPDLLEALENLLEFCESHKMDNAHTQAARTAIKKATNI